MKRIMIFLLIVFSSIQFCYAEEKWQRFYEVGYNAGYVGKTLSEYPYNTAIQQTISRYPIFNL